MDKYEHILLPGPTFALDIETNTVHQVKDCSMENDAVRIILFCPIGGFTSQDARKLVFFSDIKEVKSLMEIL